MLIHQVDGAVELCRLLLAMGDRDAAREQLARAKTLVKETESPYVPYEPDWEEWDPPEYIGVIQAGEIVGYHRRNDELRELEEALEG
jgi:hypothetical protein